MPEPLIDSHLLDTVLGDGALDDQAGVEQAPANRAARRGRAGKHGHSGAVHPDSAGRARAAQGRRINPVRRNAG